MTRSQATFLAFAFALTIIRDAGADTYPPLTTRSGAVAADNSQASAVGVAILDGGGNAVDAAIATAFALGVVHPVSSGIGGGGFALVYVAKERRTYAFDFRETGPAAIRPELFSPGGVYQPELSRRSGLAVGVPGEVAGLDLMSRRFGRLPWSKLVEPAVGLADNGFELSHFLRGVIARWLEGRTGSPRLRRVLRALASKKTGSLIRRRHLAKTLRRVARSRSAGFYSGPVAKDIVESVRRAGGVLSEADLRDYKVRQPSPLRGQWRGMTVMTMPLPSSGGIALLEAFGILDALSVDLASMGAGSSAANHIIVEALKHAFADRSRFLGDRRPDTVVDRILDRTRLRRLAQRISVKRTAPSRRYGDRSLGKARAIKPDSGTSHLCVVDAEGNAVALTTTVNTYFGSDLLTERTGIILNDEIDDFTIASGQPNAYGLVQSDYNLVGPGKRPLSSMTPVLVFDGDRVAACAGGSGGPRIISNTLQALVNIFVFALDVRQAVEAHRIHHQWRPDRILVETGTVRDVVDGLKKRGHALKMSPSKTAVQMIVVDSEGMRSAASDPRKGGRPAVQQTTPP